MKQFLVFSFLVILITGCADEGTGAASPATEDRTTEPSRSVLLAPLQKLSALQKADPAFSQELFSDFFPAGAIDTAAARPFDKGYLEQYAAYLVYKEDSSKALDAYSYSHFFLPGDEKKELKSGSPETELALLDFSKGTRQRVGFFGPSYTLLDAGWKDGNTILVAVGEVIGDNKIHPELWELNLQEFTKKISAYPDTLRYQVP